MQKYKVNLFKYLNLFLYTDLLKGAYTEINFLSVFLSFIYYYICKAYKHTYIYLCTCDLSKKSRKNKLLRLFKKKQEEFSILYLIRASHI